MSQWGNKRSFTLIECVTAMGLCALLVTSLSSVFRVTNRTWGLYMDRGRTLQQMRWIMFRMTSEIKYAEKLLALNDNTIEFQTRYLEDTDDGIETIKYEWIHIPSPESRNLYRYVDGGAGINMIPLGPYLMQFTGYKVDSGDTLVPLDLGGSDTIDDAAAVGIEMTFRFSNWLGIMVENIPVRSLVYLRNMQ